MPPDTPNQEDSKGRLKIILTLVVLVAIGVGGYFFFAKKSTPVVQTIQEPPTATSTSQISHLEAPYDGEWGKVSGLPGKISFDYPTFGKESFIIVGKPAESETVMRLIKVLHTEEQPPFYYGQIQYTILLSENPKHKTLEQWFAENFCSELIGTTGIYTITKLPNSVQVFEITGQLPDSFLNNCGPLSSLLLAVTPSGNTIINIGIGQEHSFEGLTDGYGITKVFYSLLGSLSEGSSGISMAQSFYIEQPVDVSTWKTYRNEKHRFELKYPPSGRVEEIKMGEHSNIIFYLNVYYGNSKGYLLIKKNDSRETTEDYILEPYRACISNPALALEIEGPCQGLPPGYLPELSSFHIGGARGLTEWSSYFFNSPNYDNIIFITDGGLSPTILSTFKFIQ